MVKNPPSNVGDMGLIPGSGTNTSHVVRQLSLQVTTKEPACCTGTEHSQINKYRLKNMWSFLGFHLKLKFFLCESYFKVFIEFVSVLLVLCFGFLGMRHVGS